jgi:hypothetical protein
LSEQWLTSFVRQLPSDEWACVTQFLFTFGLLVGVTPDTYRTRFCYERMTDAIAALLTWDGSGDPPGPWIKEKGRGVERSNPLSLAGIPIVTETQKRAARLDAAAATGSVEHYTATVEDMLREGESDG